MMIKNIILVLLSFFILSACETIHQVKFGRVPQEYMESAKEFEGSYVGTMENQSVVLNLKFLEDNYALLTASPDLLDPACGSRIGSLKVVTVSDANDTLALTGATFSFDPKQCEQEVAGDSLEFTVVRDAANNIQLLGRILYHVEWKKDCSVTCSPRGCNERCTHTPVKHWLHGSFTKQ